MRSVRDEVCCWLVMCGFFLPAYVACWVFTLGAAARLEESLYGELWDYWGGHEKES